MQAHEPAAFARLVEAFPYLGPRPPSAHEWSLLTRAASLATMESAIPAPMMRGIESVASELVGELGDNPDLGALDMEAIGRRVLANVSGGDVEAFAANLDKILPAVTNLPK